MLVMVASEFLLCADNVIFPILLPPVLAFFDAAAASRMRDYLSRLEVHWVSWDAVWWCTIGRHLFSYSPILQFCSLHHNVAREVQLACDDALVLRLFSQTVASYSFARVA